MKLLPTGLLFSALCLALWASEDQDEPAAGAGIAGPPEHGAVRTVSLGRDEDLAFVWIEPLLLWVGKFEVTNGEYRRYDPEHDVSSYHGYLLGNQAQPAAMVTWEDARNYCEWLNRHFSDQIPTGSVFRLPTEKEWETFAGCGDERRFPWGNEWPPPSVWNYRGEEGSGGIFRFFAPKHFIAGHVDDFIVSCPAEESGANEWGLYGVGGNVWELCEDWFDTNKTARVIRGASWSNYLQDSLALACRAPAPPREKTGMIGFRVVVGKRQGDGQSVP